MRSRKSAGRRDRPVAENLLTVAPQVPLLVEALHQNAHRVRFILPVEQSIELRIRFARQISVHRLDRCLGREWLAEIEGFARNDVDGAGNAAFDEIGGRAFADDLMALECRWQQREADTS